MAPLPVRNHPGVLGA